MQGWTFPESIITNPNLTEPEIRHYFNVLFSTRSKNQASYKIGPRRTWLRICIMWIKSWYEAITCLLTPSPGFIGIECSATICISSIPAKKQLTIEKVLNSVF